MINTGGREFVFVISGDAAGVEAAGKKAQRALQDAGDSTAGLDAAQKRATASSDSLAGSLLKAGAGAYGLQRVTQFAMDSAAALVQAQINADKLNLQLGAGGGAARAGQELDYVRELSNRLGLELNTTAASYAKLMAAARGTSMEGRGVRDMFESVAKSASVMGLDVGETEGVLRALEQMLSKGKVQAEELRGQLGDRLPGAFQIAARAMGVTTAQLSDMLEKGEVIATDFLPRFARQLDQEMGEGADKAADKMGAAVNRTTSAWDLLKQTVAQAGVGEFMKGQLNIAADGLNGISEAMRRAKEQGGGFASQMFSASGAALQFINPFNAIAYSAQSVSGELQQAKEKVEALKRELVSNPGNIFLRPAIAETEELIRKLEQAKLSTINLRAVDNASMQKYERGQEEESARRKAALAKVTADLSRKNTQLIESLDTLRKSYQAGELAESDYRRMVQSAYDQYLPKPAAKAAKAEPPVDHLVLDKYDGQAKLAKAAFDADAKVRDFMLDQVQKSDERQMQARERQLDQTTKFAERLVSETESIYANQIPSAQARNTALLAIERARLSSQLTLLGIEGEQRKRVQDEIDRYILAREAELTEDLKPEWQKRLEAWQDTTELMRTAYDQAMDGWLDKGEEVFTDWVKTGKFSAKTLANFIGDELAKAGYRQFVAPMMAQAGSNILGLLFSAMGGGLSIDTAGYGIGSSSGTVGLPTRGGAATGSNYLERDMLTILHKGEAVIPRAFNPWGDGAGSGGMRRAASAPPVVQHITYHVPPGQSPAAYAAALQSNNQQLKAEMAGDMMRPGRPLQRAAARAR